MEGEFSCERERAFLVQRIEEPFWEALGGTRSCFRN